MAALAAKIMGGKEALALHLDTLHQAVATAAHINTMEILVAPAAAVAAMFPTAAAPARLDKGILVALVILKITVLAVAAAKDLLVRRHLALLAEMAAQVQLLALVGHQGL